MMPLNLAPLKEVQIIAEIHGHSDTLDRMGLAIGTDVTLLDRKSDALVVSVHGQPVQLTRSLASHIMV
ncbi:MAG: FeoA family protein [Candidatus Merdivicinus sp.]